MTKQEFVKALKVHMQLDEKKTLEQSSREQHVFSKEFEKNMNELIHTKHTKIYLCKKFLKSLKYVPKNLQFRAAYYLIEHASEREIAQLEQFINETKAEGMSKK